MIKKFVDCKFVTKKKHVRILFNKKYIDYTGFQYYVQKIMPR